MVRRIELLRWAAHRSPDGGQLTRRGVGVARGPTGFGANGHPRSTWNLGQSMLAALKGLPRPCEHKTHKPERLVVSHARCIGHPELETVLRGALACGGRRGMLSKEARLKPRSYW